MLAVETIREDVWLRAFEVSMNRGYSVEASTTNADNLLAVFDKKFPKHSTSDAELPFGKMK